MDAPVLNGTGSEEEEEVSVVRNDSGKCNMWTVEQFVRTKIDSSGVKFKFEGGDFILYDLTKSGADDYSSGGTH